MDIMWRSFREQLLEELFVFENGAQALPSAYLGRRGGVELVFDVRVDL
jgi:hypothetical protein